MTRRLDTLDRLWAAAERTLRAAAAAPRASGRPNPARDVPEGELDAAARRESGRLLRVDHAGEVCAQALYLGQAAASADPELRAHLDRAAKEEGDHLVWCRERLEELDARPSRLDPLWYAGAWAIGAAAGLAGDRFSLGFLAETERQVVEHLEGHLRRLPAEDRRSRAILEQMQRDEGEHATRAIERGGEELPAPLKTVMRFAARVMTTTAYWV